jgi:enoyl-CoA hydratase/carnithine racemase
MTIAPGHSYNSGAGLLAASGIPSICEDSSIAFNECTFGFVPHAGSCYYTSRLPGDMGTFLALTGLPMTGKDAIKLGVADSLIELPKTYEHEAADIMISMDPSNLHTARQHRAAEHSGIHEHK